MIRFIDLGDQLLIPETKHFAWFDTVTDTFESYSYQQAWESWEDFEEAYRDDERKPLIEDSHSLERYRGLFPKEWPLPNRGKLVKMKEKLDKLLRRP